MAEALCAAQKQMRNPKKDKTAKVRTRTGGEYTYNFTTLDAVLDIVRPALNDNGIFLTQRSEMADGMVLLTTSVMFDAMSQVLDVTPYQYDTDPQEFGKRETYARRYSLLKAFGLSGDDDTDGDTGAQQKQAPASNQADARNRAFANMAKLKMQAMENGVKEEGINSWFEAKYGDTPINRLSTDQIREVTDSLQTIVRDSASVRGSNEHQ